MTPDTSIAAELPVETGISPESPASSLSQQLVFIDLHTHSNHSDGIPSIEQIEDHCLRKQMSIALTDHNEVRGSVLLCERSRIPVLPGLEVGTQEGLEFLVYFPDAGLLEDYYTSAVEPFLLQRFMVRSRVRAVDCLEVAREMGAYISLAHPFAFGRKSLDYQHRSRRTSEAFVEDVLSRVDAVELFNGGVPVGVNRKAAVFLAGRDLPVTVGSDSHRLKTHGTSGVFLPATDHEDSRSLFTTLRDADLHGTEMVSGSVGLTLPVIMFKHTLFFLKAGNHPKWKNGR